MHLYIHMEQYFQCLLKCVKSSHRLVVSQCTFPYTLSPLQINTCRLHLCLEISSERCGIIQLFLDFIQLKVTLTTTFKGFSKNSAVSYTNTRWDDLLNFNRIRLTFRITAPQLSRRSVAHSHLSFLTACYIQVISWLPKTTVCLAHICKIF